MQCISPGDLSIQTHYPGTFTRYGGPEEEKNMKTFLAGLSLYLVAENVVESCFVAFTYSSTHFLLKSVSGH